MTRRRLLTTALGAATATVAADPRPATAWWWREGQDWPTAAHDLAGTRSAPVGVRRARVRWVATLAGGIPGAAAISGRTVVAASLGGEVAAFDLLTGRERWRTAPAGREGFFAGPAIAGDRVIVASDRALALDLHTGTTLWTADSLRAGGTDDYFWSPPTVVAGLVLIGSGSAGEGAGGIPVRGRLTAYDLRTGRLRWSTPTVADGANGGGVLGPPTVDLRSGKAYITTGAAYSGEPTPGTSSLLEVRLEDGTITATAPSGSPHDLNSAALLLGRRIFATGKDGLHAWDRVGLRHLWSTAITPPAEQPGPTDGPEFGPLATDGTKVYVISNDSPTSTSTTAALDPSTGTILWRTTLPTFTFGAPALAGPHLHTATSDGTLHSLSLTDGRPTRTIDLGAPSASTLSSAHGLLLAGTGAAPHLPGDTLTALG